MLMMESVKSHVSSAVNQKKRHDYIPAHVKLSGKKK